jgi:caffeoyl-CoA O-methyltransferase
MNAARFARWCAPALLLCVCTAAELPKNSEAFRKEFLDKFSRTGLNTTPPDAMMLRILVESRGAKRGVEVGAASGFGAMNMGIAFERTGGHLFSLEIDPRRVQVTRQNLEKLGLEKSVTVVEGDALKTLGTLTGEFDFVFLDALKPDYMKYLKLIEPKLKRGAIVVADNVMVSERQMTDFLSYVRTSPDYDTVTIRASDEKGDGMTISYKIR